MTHTALGVGRNFGVLDRQLAWSGDGLRLDAAHLGLELGEVGELPVDGGEEDARDWIEVRESAQRKLADVLRLDLRSSRRANLRGDGVGEVLELRLGDRPLVGRARETAQQLLAIERLPRAVALDDGDRRRLGALVRREAHAAVLALAPAADRVARLGEPGVDHAGRGGLAGGAPHGPYSTRCGVLL